MNSLLSFSRMAACLTAVILLLAGSPFLRAENSADAAIAGIKSQLQELNSGDASGVAKLQTSIEDFIKKHPSHEDVPGLKQLQIQLVSMFETPNKMEVLKKYAKDSDEQVAAQAKAMLAKIEKLEDLKKTPLDLEFQATDGSQVNFQKLRGKVVLLDFWASWCGPCMAELPNVVKTWNELKGKGFEVIGVSLDEEKSDMEKALKETGAGWPQFFDGQGWKSKIGTEFGVDSIPATFIFDKKGLLRHMNLHGEEMREAVEKLLAEK